MKTPFQHRLGAIAIGTLFTIPSAWGWGVSQTPAFVPSALPPNIVVTLDDSGSMRWAYAPDGICGAHNTRRAKSADFNPLYYNPRLKYDAPPKADGTLLSTSFTKAWHNGFDTGRGSRDLGSEYQVTWAYDPTSDGKPTSFDQCGGSSTNNNFASNPDADYKPKSGTDRTRTGVPAYYYLYDKALSGCSAIDLTKESCYSRVEVGVNSGKFDRDGDGVIDADERQNFANWYSFYRTRNLMTVSAAAKAFQTVPDGARLAWQSLNTCNATFVTSNTSRNCSGVGGNKNSLIRLYDTTHRASFYDWLFRLPANGGTPLRAATQRAGEYFRTNTTSQKLNTPYAEEPQVRAGRELACRPNAHILMTDGIWNESDGKFCGSNTCDNLDNKSTTLPDGRKYDATADATRIYRDGSSNALSDVTFFYWANDLRPDLADLLMPYTAEAGSTEDATYWNPKNDPARWQHMVTFTVGLGLKSTLTVKDAEWFNDTYGTNPLGGAAQGGYPNLLSGKATWPAASSNSSPGNVYDLWHAAINSRGQAFNAENPKELTEALAGALSRIEATDGAAAALTANSTRLSTGTLIYQARFNSGNWSGQLDAYKVNSNGGKGQLLWAATSSGKIASHDKRAIYTWNGNSGIEFKASPLKSAGLWPASGADEVVDWLRGDPSREKRKGGLFRDRINTVLGDVVNSDPVFVGDEDYGYSGLPEGLASGATGYDKFVYDKKSCVSTTTDPKTGVQVCVPRRAMLYVGANDGMLHAFDAKTGEERFSYVPKTVIPYLAELADPDYKHRFYVDGSPMAIDAFLNGQWRTILIGTTGAGGKGIFALDITEPDSFDASKVLWEVDASTSAEFKDLGLTMSQPQVFKMNNGQWAVIVGNGYLSDNYAAPDLAKNHKASLYVLDLATGAMIRKIETGVGGDSNNSNGLGTPALYDANADGLQDYAYAADMLGNIWKFDLRDANASNWRISFNSASGFPNGAPLFQARDSSGNAQPIQGGLELARPPAGVAGLMVLFGTGRFLSTADKASISQQTFYGILDNGSAITSTNRSALQEQTISERNISYSYSYTTSAYDANGDEILDADGNPTGKVETGTKTETFRDLSQNTVNYTSGKRGWFTNLPTAGERVIGSPVIRGGRLLYTTQIPSDDPCAFGGDGWLMQVEASSGRQYPKAMFDTNLDRTVNDSDLTISGVRITVGMGKQVLTLDGTPRATALISGTTGNIQSTGVRSFANDIGRESWRELTRQ